MSDRIADLEAVLRMHRAAGKSDEQLRLLESFQELQAIAPNSPLITGNSADRIAVLEASLRMHRSAGTSDEKLRTFGSFRELETIKGTRNPR